jgi:hypothetical protein
MDNLESIRSETLSRVSQKKVTLSREKEVRILEQEKNLQEKYLAHCKKFHEKYLAHQMQGS